MRPGVGPQVHPHAADEARKLVAFGGMANQVGRLVNHQQFRVFVYDLEKLVHVAG
jgi:hypothetical protein